jgi:hypothetical protein
MPILFIEWWVVRRFAILLALLVVSCAAIWFVRKRRRSLRIAIAIVGSPIAVLASLFLALQVLALGCLSYSNPVFSPDHSQAARVRTDDEGALGGNSSVELFSKHGLSATEVYWGRWTSVDVKDVRWVSDTDLDIVHDGPMYYCQSSSSVKVHCRQRASAPTSPTTSHLFPEMH